MISPGKTNLFQTGYVKGFKRYVVILIVKVWSKVFFLYLL